MSGTLGRPRGAGIRDGWRPRDRAASPSLPRTPGIHGVGAGAGGRRVAIPWRRFAREIASWREALRARPALAAGLAVAGAFALIFALRVAFVDRAFDVFTDEVTYLQISQDLAGGQGLTLHGDPFFLHPPLFFVVEGIVVAIFHPSGLMIDQVQAIRVLNAVLAGLTGLALYAIVVPVAGRRAALVVLAIFALDPFIIRINSRNLIETSAFLWVALGYLVLLRTIGQPSEGDGSGRRAAERQTASAFAGSRQKLGTLALRSRPLVAGVLFGFAVLSKEMTFFLTVVPLVFAAIVGFSLRRRDALASIGAAAMTYAIYPIAIVLSGLGPQFFEQKFSGLLRFVGIEKTTGFVAGGPSFASAVTRNLDTFATTYVLLAVGIPACLVLLAFGGRRRRLIGLLGASAYALLAYSIAFGTLEEQFFYYLVLPALVTTTIAWRMLVEERVLSLAGFGSLRPSLRPIRLALDHPFVHRLWSSRGRVEAAFGFVAPVALAVAVAWSALVWVEVHATPDDGYQRLLSYMHRNVPNGTRIGVTSDPQEFLIQGYVIENARTPAEIVTTRVRYVAITTKQVEEGYVPNGRALLNWLAATGQPVFAFDGRSYGTLILYRMPGAAADAAPSPAGPLSVAGGSSP